IFLCTSQRQCANKTVVHTSSGLGAHRTRDLITIFVPAVFREGFVSWDCSRDPLSTWLLPMYSRSLLARTLIHWCVLRRQRLENRLSALRALVGHLSLLSRTADSLCRTLTLPQWRAASPRCWSRRTVVLKWEPLHDAKSQSATTSAWLPRGSWRSLSGQ